ncbi:hypothetical protein [Phormidium sp. CCY1219]|uniref:hypothetical protein n=1 Tax=Phormidium sp. CCY1219 TaxID=2886104 RepID=UPI002D1F8411|nr:hypothetical protein [Phormidium sp. CCY1219]MEB3828444.1 hypothetical protein [Phormidium sp. CCY1219]
MPYFFFVKLMGHPAIAKSPASHWVRVFFNAIFPLGLRESGNRRRRDRCRKTPPTVTTGSNFYCIAIAPLAPNP